MNPYLLRKPSQIRIKPRLTAVDLFSGAGGITLGLLNAGFNIVFCSDRDPVCAVTHRRNFPDIPFAEAPIEQLSGADILREAGLKRDELDLLIGGPPCQGFSIIGQREIWDVRNGLFREFLRLAKELRPKCLVIENVPGLATLEGGTVLRQIGDAFREAGYTIDCAELLAAQYGVPQMRWRMFFIGWRNDLGKRGGFPKPTHGRAGIGDLYPNKTISPEETDGFVTIREAIGDLPRVRAGELQTRYTRPPQSLYQEAMRRSTQQELANHYAPRLSEQNLARIKSLKPGQDWRDLPRDLLPPSMQRALRKDHTRRFRRMRWEGIARSIITRFRDPKSGEYSHPDQDRTISIREAARIQSFPDWFVFEGGHSAQYDQVGNAVPPLLARAVGAELRRMLLRPRPEERPPVKSRYRIPVDLFQLAAE
ncbi:DNA cytosine methyltransferase [Bradyrhizobium manausense]|uniref:DNA cytosine methyltransferase n=1 Tax=Bradyrhizobium manausense TaxID=989370 RepID=UPI001BAC1E37|nr:DNA cytosine methyltransferase [Bradyrhizobium manausense]MBR0689593.1 DNA cytosine methyltransferase [Bradyrhizobium manausense]